MNLVVVFVVLFLVVVGVVGDIRLAGVVAQVNAEHSAECYGSKDTHDGRQRQHESNHDTGKVDGTQRVQDYCNITSTPTSECLSTNSHSDTMNNHGAHINSSTEMATNKLYCAC